jgi:hypothetical protein
MANTGLEDFMASSAWPLAFRESPFVMSLYSNPQTCPRNRQEGDGFAHTFCGSQVTFKTAVSHAALSQHVRNAWINLRFLTPLIAASTLPVSGCENNSYVFSYESSTTKDVAEHWAMETIKWKKERKTLGEWELEIKDGWWKPSDGHFNGELHVAPGESGSWLFM